MCECIHIVRVSQSKIRLLLRVLEQFWKKWRNKNQFIGCKTNRNSTAYDLKKFASRRACLKLSFGNWFSKQKKRCTVRKSILSQACNVLRIWDQFLHHPASSATVPPPYALIWRCWETKQHARRRVAVWISIASNLEITYRSIYGLRVNVSVRMKVWKVSFV